MLSPEQALQTERIYGTPEHIAWMKALPCAFCGVIGYSVCAHVRNAGMSKKADWQYTVPACENVPVCDRIAGGIPRRTEIRPGCHHDFDHNKRTWRAKYDTDALAAKYVTLWQRHLAAVGPRRTNAYAPYPPENRTHERQHSDSAFCAAPLRRRFA